MLGKVVVRYSEAFKIQVVRELEEGRFESVLAAQRAYGIRGAETVGNWMRRLGKDHLLRKVVRVMKADERTEVQELRRRVRQLEGLVADKELDLRIEQAYVKLACEVAGIEDVGEFKKKHAGGLRTK